MHYDAMFHKYGKNEDKWAVVNSAIMMVDRKSCCCSSKWYG